MVRNSQNTLIKKAFISAREIKNGEINFRLDLLSKSLKKNKISIYVFKEWFNHRNKYHAKGQCPKEWLDYTIDTIYQKY